MARLYRNQDGTLPKYAFVDDDGRVKEDLHCPTCGYNLRKLEADGDCPECGASIRSAFLTLAHVGDAGWLRTVRMGSFLILCGAFLRLVYCCVPELSSGQILVQATLLFFLGVPMTVGAWFFASPEPQAVPQHMHLPATMTLRISAIIELLLTVAIPLAGGLNYQSAAAVVLTMVWALAHAVMAVSMAWLIQQRLARLHMGWDRYIAVPAAAVYALGIVAVGPLAAINNLGIIMCVLFFPAIGGFLLLYYLMELASKLYPLEVGDEWD